MEAKGEILQTAIKVRVLSNPLSKSRRQLIYTASGTGTPLVSSPSFSRKNGQKHIAHKNTILLCGTERVLGSESSGAFNPSSVTMASITNKAQSRFFWLRWNRPDAQTHSTAHHGCKQTKIEMTQPPSVLSFKRKKKYNQTFFLVILFFLEMWKRVQRPDRLRPNPACSSSQFYAAVQEQLKSRRMASSLGCSSYGQDNQRKLKQNSDSAAATLDLWHATRTGAFFAKKPQIISAVD